MIGRQSEKEKLKEIEKSGEPAIVVVHGRRRVGKTYLIEHTFEPSRLIKIEGVEGQDSHYQRKTALVQLSRSLKKPLLEKVAVENWGDFFDILWEQTKNTDRILYFEELQWLAEYKTEFVAELKRAWDNSFSKKKNGLIVLCGSSPSFMINQVIQSKSLYNRSVHEITLKEFSLSEVQEFLGKKYSQREIMDGYLSVGGIPEYLKYLKMKSSILLSLAENSFKPDAFFVKEKDRIFVSSLSESTHYKKIVQFLSQNRFATKNEIANYLGITPGGTLAVLLEDLEVCGFINSYTPFHLGEKSKLVRYHISDQYLQFYSKFIHPIQKDIQAGRYLEYPLKALKTESWDKWLGYSFERFCRQQHHFIAKLIGFSAVEYSSGAYFIKGDKKSQIDLIFERRDHVVTVCEIKYLRGLVTKSVISEYEEKIKTLKLKKRQRVERVLISAEGMDSALQREHYFDHVITLKDFFGRK